MKQEKNDQTTTEETPTFVSDEDIVKTENLWDKYQQQREERRKAGNKGEPKFVSDEDILYRRTA